jgi:AcrR family transcriptional regulator
VSPHIPRKPRRPVGRPGSDDDVRGAILTAALRQLEATGSPDRVTVASIVDEAGCTPPSLYYYWPRRELLLKEASEDGWAQFRASQSGAVSDQDDPIERIRLRGRAYLAFAFARPALFRVLFLEPPAAGPAQPTPAQPTPARSTPARSTPARSTPAQSAGKTGEALNDLVLDVTAAMANRQITPADPLTTALALWAAIHGVATLWTVTPTLPTHLAHAVGNLAQDAVLRGLAP